MKKILMIAMILLFAGCDSMRDNERHDRDRHDSETHEHSGH
jgi:uncharacterized lipoprotein